MKKTGSSDQLALSWEEIGFLSQGLSFASRPFKSAIAGINAEYALGPRGAWILMLISSRQVVYPLDLTNFFKIGRSLITAELTRLTDSKLITYRKSSGDRRRVELALTALGEKVLLRVQDASTTMITERFAGYTREQVLLCARMLNDFIHAEPASARAESEGDASKRRRGAEIVSLASAQRTAKARS